MHLVIGAGEFLATHVTRALSAEVPVIELHADADDETLGDAIGGAEVVVNCAQTWAPGRRLRTRRRPPPLLPRLVDAARRAGVRRLVHVSTADVYGSDRFARIEPSAAPRPRHAYERLKLYEEEWLLGAAKGLEVVIVRPARVFGSGEGWMLPRLVSEAVRGRVWLPAGGRTRHTFVAAGDVGRACLAAGDRGRPGHRYLVGGFDATWRDLLVSATRAIGFAAEISSLPYDVAYLVAMAREAVTGEGAALWPGVFGVDVLAKPHLYDDSAARRELTWSPSVGSFEQEMPSMTAWLAALPEVRSATAASAPLARAEPPAATPVGGLREDREPVAAEPTSPQGR